MRHKKNITLNLQNITSHFTEKKKIITLSFRNITLSLLILILSLVNITLCFSNYNNTSALSYQSSADVKFTFNPTLSINISPSDLIIDNLTPGTVSDSNVINVSVATNASHGYTLSATVGDSLHNNTNLTHTNGTNTFDSIATNNSLPNLTTDNTWGYSYKLSNNTNWNNYSGLSNETSKTLVSTDNQLAKPIDFKIAAKAGSTQASGTYTGTINFIAISKPIPKTIDDIVYMQTFGELVSTDLQSVKNSMVLNQDYILKDIRDEKEYYVTRLEDGNVWMTQNLDLDLSSNRPLTSNDTDLSDYTSTAYQDGYANNNNIIYWTPSNTTIVATLSNGQYSLIGWQDNNDIPYSGDVGQIYVGNTTSRHNLVGNFYNWAASAATNKATAIISDEYGNVSVKNSICPKGWRIPTTSGSQVDIPGSTAEFLRLNYIYNNNKTNTIVGLVSSPLYFVTAGYVKSSGDISIGGSGNYWTSINRNTKNAYYIDFSTGLVKASNMYVGKSFGGSIRCLAR